jgi:hypothetical protein
MSLTVLWLRYGSAVLEVLHYLGACARLDSWPGAVSNLRLRDAHLQRKRASTCLVPSTAGVA